MSKKIESTSNIVILQCQLRQRNQNKGVVVRPNGSKDFNSLGQVDLPDDAKHARWSE